VKKLLTLAGGIVAAAYLVITQSSDLFHPHASHTDASIHTEAALYDAISRRASGAEVTGRGFVVKVLPDDSEGSRHQRFIIRLDSGQTLLIAHNIDIAPRVAGVGEGDEVSFRGEYEWNDRGGVVHWTHRDPDGSHPGGWLKHAGQVYR
jgi:hypothetical protein